MATPPFNPDETKPGDSDIVSQFPAVERTFRDIVEDWINFEHDPTGHHAFLEGTTTARDAITDWVVGSLWYNTTTSVLQIVTSIGPVVWADVSGPLGTAASENTGTSGHTIPFLDGANTWSATQIIESTDADAAVAPVYELYRNSATPAINDLIGQLLLAGESSTGVKRTYADVIGKIIDPTNTLEDGELVLRAIVAGTLAARFHVGAGVYTPGATGGDKGADTINASELYDDGERIAASKLDTEQATTSGTDKNFTSPFATTIGFEVLWDGVSAAGSTDNIVIRIGPSGGLETSGYVGGTSALNAHSTWGGGGFEVATGPAVADLYTGRTVGSLMNAGTNKWVVSGLVDEGGTQFFSTAGIKSLAGLLTQLSVTFDGATDAFDAGAVNVRWFGY